MLCFPNCKINLGLYVTEKRPDGYHNLETVFYPVQLKDALEIVPSAETKLHLSGKAVAGDSANNLVWKAYQLLKQDFPAIPSFDIYLHKAIPMGAGMGGGSADGAFMLHLINKYCALGLSDEKLAEYALKLGSDCPFFIYDTPKFAEGRGEKMEDISVDLSAYSIQLICPQVHISTRKAFSMLTPKPAPFNLRKLSELLVSQWKDSISNDFEGPIFKEHLSLAEVKQQLYVQGAIYASMSGSGSSIYGIFPKGKRADVQTDLPLEQHYIA